MAALIEAADETAEQLLEERHAIYAQRDELTKREEVLEHRLELLEEIRKLAAQLDGARDASANGGGAAPDPEAAPLSGRNGGNAPEPELAPPSGSAPSGNGGTKPKAKPPAAPAAARTPPSVSNRDLVLEHIENVGEAKAADVVAALGLSANIVRQQLGGLVRDGAIKARGATKSRAYMSTTRALELDAARIDSEPTPPKTQGKAAAKSIAPAALRPKVTDLIARNPGQLTAPLLAQGIPADEADVALVCNQLLDEKAIERTTNGAFRIVLEDQWS